ncbi:MAG TPA: hypothetical protein DCX53_00160 [Anaerolineae bacterium]|nr:hypothetical protein [Anaerolineae bacterium]
MDINKQEPKGILLITGTVGTGKTVVATEIGEQLGSMSILNAVIDLDWLGWINVGDDFDQYDSLIMQNVISAWQNYHAAGVEYLVLARMLLQREPVDILTRAFPHTPITIVRLVTSKNSIENRLSQRDSGETLREHLHEIDVMNRVLGELHLEHATVYNEDQSVEDTARQVINFINWK